MSVSSDKAREWRVANPRQKVINNLISRCKRTGVPYDRALLENIVCPAECYYLQTPISFEMGKGRRPPENTASFDRITPELGYVVGNVIIISMLANRMKSNSTPDQRRKFCRAEMADQADHFAPC